MAKRIILISSFPICVVLVIIALILAGVGHGQPASTPANIEQAKSQTISSVNLGKLDDANTAIDKLIAGYANNANSASTLADAANQCAGTEITMAPIGYTVQLLIKSRIIQCRLRPV